MFEGMEMLERKDIQLQLRFPPNNHHHRDIIDDSGTSLSLMQISPGRCVPGTPMDGPTTASGRSNAPTAALTQSLPPNIIALICAELRLLLAWGSLARLARTDHLFCDAALDALWHSITSLVPLLHTFPPDLCSIDGKRKWAFTYIVSVLKLMVDESDRMCRSSLVKRSLRISIVSGLMPLESYK